MIDKLTYLKRTFTVKAYADKGFLQAILSIQLEDENSSGLFSKIPYCIFIKENKFNYIDPVTNENIEVEGDVTVPLCFIDEKLSLPNDFHPMITNDVNTTFGIFLFNIVLFWDVFGDIVPYHNGEFTKKLLMGILSDIMEDDPAPGETLPPGKASVSACMRFTEHSYFLEGLCIYFVKCSSIQALTVDPSIIKRKKELFELHKDSLKDPVIFTKIVDELVDMDLELQMKGDSKTFYIERKFIDNARKRMFIAFGTEFDVETNSWVPLTNSLDEGYDFDKINVYINTAVEGSFQRGKATGEGGSQVKEIIRLVGRSTIIKEDCGSLVGERTRIINENKKFWIGSFHIVNKLPVLITKDNCGELVDKMVSMRAPQYCMVDGGDYCSTCLGTGLGKNKEHISADVTDIPTSMMLLAMKLSHTAGLSTTKVNLNTVLN